MEEYNSKPLSTKPNPSVAAMRMPTNRVKFTMLNQLEQKVCKRILAQLMNSKSVTI